MTFDRRFWLNHACWPLLLFLLVAATAAATGLDEHFARSWAFDATAKHFIGTGAGEWWAKTLIHRTGGNLMRGLALLLLLLWAGTYFSDSLRQWRRPASFVIVCVALGTGTVDLLKQTSNIDCPRSLVEFGGHEPYVSLFGTRPATLPKAHCFPGGHSSTGFALFALYFLSLARSRRVARLALVLAISVGGLFAVGQEARGAHFLSHDAWSAAIAWFACLGVYVIGYRGEVWAPAQGRCRVARVPDMQT